MGKGLPQTFTETSAPARLFFFEKADLPLDMSDAFSPSNLDRQYIIRKGHGNIENVCKEIGRPLKTPSFYWSYLRQVSWRQS